MGKLIGPTIGGNLWGLFGGTGFFLSGVSYDVAAFAIFLFQMVFMDTALTIPTGSMAERWKLSAFVIYGFVASAVIYPLFANWAWGGGWLSTLGKYAGLGHGYVDFAGSGVVHLTGGVMAFTGALVLGPRIGKYVKGEARAIPGHNLPMAILGCFILAFGWFGFNAGSTLAGTDLRISVVATNTMLASASGALLAFLVTWRKYGRPDPSMSANGMLAGLVAITAPCAFVNAPVAVLIGAVSGVLVVYAALFIENMLKIDDPVGAIAVHGVNGAWGLVALGLFADGTYGGGLNGGPAAGVTGLFYGDGRQLVAQLIGIVANVAWVGLSSFALFKVLDATVGMRVSPAQEIQGLDFNEVSAPAYPGERPSVNYTGLRRTAGGGRRRPGTRPEPGPGRRKVSEEQRHEAHHRHHPSREARGRQSRALRRRGRGPHDPAGLRPRRREGGHGELPRPSAPLRVPRQDPARHRRVRAVRAPHRQGDRRRGADGPGRATARSSSSRSSMS